MINSFYSFQWIFLKPYVLFVDTSKVFIWSFNGDNIIFDRITAFKTKSFLHIGYGVCVINSCTPTVYNGSFSDLASLLPQFSVIVFKLYNTFGAILKMCMWPFDFDEIYIDRITSF